MTTTTDLRVNGRNFTSRYSPVLLPDSERCRWTKEYGLSMCNDPASHDITFNHGGTPRTYGYCSWHAPLAVAREKRHTGATVKAVAR